MIPRRKLPIEEDDQEPLLNSMATKNEIDPYYSVRDHVQSQLERIKLKHERFQDLLRTVDTSSSSEFKEVRKGLRQDVRAVDKEILGLKEAVDTIEKNRAKFMYIKDNELQNRKRFVEDSQKSVSAVKASMDSSAVRKKIEEDTRRVKREAFDEVHNARSQQLNQENDRFISDQKQVTRKLIQDQDQDLEKLGHAVGRLEQVGREINLEIKTQGKLLDALGNEIDVAGEKMNSVQAALSKLLKTKDTCQIWTIVILALVLILLVALVIWT